MESKCPTRSACRSVKLAVIGGMSRVSLAVGSGGRGMLGSMILAGMAADRVNLGEGVWGVL